MRRPLIFILLAFLLAACVPGVAPVTERTGEVVTITVAPERALFDVTLSVPHATSDDARCVVLNVTDVGCVLGDLGAGDSTVVVVRGQASACVLFGYVNERRGVTDYRSFPCTSGG